MRIVLIGSGNLGTQLGLALAEKEHRIIQVFSMTEDNASELAANLYCPFTTDPDEIIKDADLYIIAVRDSAIELVVENIDFDTHLVVHTSGTVPLSVFENHCQNFGVFYPLQTFSKNKRVEFNAIPILIEANTDENNQILKNIAGSISDIVLSVNSEKRSRVHLAAVFACNFVNHFYLIAEELLKDKDLGFELLKPLIMETASKVIQNSPGQVQTGPAIRNDKKVMEEHLKMLSAFPEWERFYQLISDNIYNTHKI